MDFMSTTSIAGLILQYKYFIMVPASLLAGPLVGMISGFLIRIGGLEFWPSYVALMSGELIGDILWYWTGYHYGERFASGLGKYVGITEKHIATAKRLFSKHNRRILIITKLTTGFGFGIAVMFTAGLSKVPFRRYMTINIIGQLIWTAGLIAIGFFFENFYLQVNNAFDKVYLISAMAVFLLCIVGVARYAGRRFLKQYE